MSNKIILLLVLFTFLPALVFAQAKGGKGDLFSSWSELLNRVFGGEIGVPDWLQRQNTPGALADFLTAFGIPRELSVNWGAIVFYIFIPLAVFALVLKSILVDEIIVNTMRVTTFQGDRGWIFVILILLFLLPTGLVGRAALWLYAAAGILVIYGFGALLVIAVAERLLFRITGWWGTGTLIAIFLALIFTFFNPAFAVLIGGLGMLMGIRGYLSHRRVSVLGSFAIIKAEISDLTARINSVERSPSFARLSEDIQNDLRLYMSSILTRFGSGEILNVDDAKKIINQKIDEINLTLPAKHPKIPHV